MEIIPNITKEELQCLQLKAKTHVINYYRDIYSITFPGTSDLNNLDSRTFFLFSKILQIKIQIAPVNRKVFTLFMHLKRCWLENFLDLTLQKNGFEYTDQVKLPLTLTIMHDFSKLFLSTESI